MSAMVKAQIATALMVHELIRVVDAGGVSRDATTPIITLLAEARNEDLEEDSRLTQPLPPNVSPTTGPAPVPGAGDHIGLRRFGQWMLDNAGSFTPKDVRAAAMVISHYLAEIGVDPHTVLGALGPVEETAYQEPAWAEPGASLHSIFGNSAQPAFDPEGMFGTDSE